MFRFHTASYIARGVYMINSLELNIPLEVKKDIGIAVDTLLEKLSFNISKIVLFGSYAKGKYQPDSDIDIAVVLNELPAAKELRYYKQIVELDRDIDLLFCTTEQLTSDKFVYRWINEQGVVLYEKL